MMSGVVDHETHTHSLRPGGCAFTLGLHPWVWELLLGTPSGDVGLRSIFGLHSSLGATTLPLTNITMFFVGSY